MSCRERDLKRLLEFHCAYCGRSKSERPPEWCARVHEVYEKQMDIAVRRAQLMGRGLQDREDGQ